MVCYRLSILSAINDYCTGTSSRHSISTRRSHVNIVQGKMIVRSKKHDKVSKRCYISTPIYNSIARIVKIHKMMSAQIHRVTIIFNRHQLCMLDIYENRIRLCKSNFTSNADRHFIRGIILGIDLNTAGINSFRDLVITALGDFHARSGDRRGRFRVFLCSYAIFRRTPPRASALTGRTDVIMHAASTALMSRIFCFFILKTSAFC